jgi:hypothetical protein
VTPEPIVEPQIVTDTQDSSETNSQSELENLEDIPLPVTINVIAPVSLMNAAGAEISIPAETSIVVMKRSPSGVLSMNIGGKVYVGSESRLAKKVRLTQE